MVLRDDDHRADVIRLSGYPGPRTDGDETNLRDSGTWKRKNDYAVNVGAGEVSQESPPATPPSA